MGNWMTVNIEGTCPASELPELKKIVSSTGNNYENFHCLVNSGGMAGVGDWAAEKIEASGNLAERGYSVEDVQEQLNVIGEKCPNADIKVHCGGDYESLECVNTVHLKNGIATILPPEKDNLEPLNEGKIRENFAKAIRR